VLIVFGFASQRNLGKICFKIIHNQNILMDFPLIFDRFLALANP